MRTMRTETEDFRCSTGDHRDSRLLYHILILILIYLRLRLAPYHYLLSS